MGQPEPDCVTLTCSDHRAVFWICTRIMDSLASIPNFSQFDVHADEANLGSSWTKWVNVLNVSCVLQMSRMIRVKELLYCISRDQKLIIWINLIQEMARSGIQKWVRSGLEIQEWGVSNRVIVGWGHWKNMPHSYLVGISLLFTCLFSSALWN